MAELNVQFVRPDRALYEGPAASLVLVSYAGELGVYPGHAAEIVALGDGVVRMKLTEAAASDVWSFPAVMPRLTTTKSSSWPTTRAAPMTSMPMLFAKRETRPSSPSRLVRTAITGARTTRTKSIGVIFC